MGGALGSGPNLRSTGRTMPTVSEHQPTRLGLIGTGLAVEKLHWPSLARLQSAFRVVAFCDRNRVAAEHFSSYSGVPMSAYTPDHQQLLRREDVEAVLVALPIAMLYTVARDALDAGKHVICEKPPGIDEPQAHEFLSTALEHSELRLLVAENIFYRDDLRLARSLLDQGAIGRVHLMAWRAVSRNVPRRGEFSSTFWRQRTQYRGGAHLDAGIHHVAQIRLLLGDPVCVHGQTQDANRTIDGPSDLSLNLRFVSRAIGSYVASYPELEVPPEDGEMHIYGTEGTLVLKDGRGERRVELHRPAGEGEVHVLRGIDGGYLGELLNFRQALTHGAPLVGTVEQSVKNLMVIERGLDSAERGEVVSLEDTPGGTHERAVPLWRPEGVEGLLDGIGGSHSVEPMTIPIPAR